jgi:hypothetical protein
MTHDQRVAALLAIEIERQTAEIERLRAENVRLRDALEQIRDWQDEPSLTKFITSTLGEGESRDHGE